MWRRLLAAGRLFGGRTARGRHLRYPDEGRRLYSARLSVLLFGNAAGASQGFGQDVLLYGGFATITFGTIGVLASQAMGRLAGYYVLVSSGSLMAAIGLGESSVLPGMLFYLLSSTLGISAFFLLIELVERARDAGADVLAVTMEAIWRDRRGPAGAGNLHRRSGTLAVLGLCFVACAMLMAGLPPLWASLPNSRYCMACLPATTRAAGAGRAGYGFTALIIPLGLATLIAMTRVGIRTFWTSIEGTIPRVRLIEITPVPGAAHGLPVPDASRPGRCCAI